MMCQAFVPSSGFIKSGLTWLRSGRKQHSYSCNVSKLQFFLNFFLSWDVLSSFIPPPPRNAFGQTSKEKETHLVYTINGSEASQNKTSLPNGCTLGYCWKNAVEVAAVELKGKS